MSDRPRREEAKAPRRVLHYRKAGRDFVPAKYSYKVAGRLLVPAARRVLEREEQQRRAAGARLHQESSQSEDARSTEVPRDGRPWQSGKNLMWTLDAPENS